jgi:hypothetical protein
LLQHTRTEPFLDQSDDSSIADTMLQKLDQPRVVDRVKEALDIGI